MQLPWFQKVGWVYRPVSWQGWFVSLVTLLFCIQSLFVIGSLGKTLGQAVFLVAPSVFCGFGAYLWIASKTDGGPHA